MALDGSGVEVRAKSIRLRFSINGREYAQTLKVDGKSLAPTAANVNYAHRVAKDIRIAIERGEFVMSTYFPHAVEASADGSLGAQLDRWMGAARVQANTLVGYGASVKFWKAAEHADGERLGEVPLARLKPSMLQTALARAQDDLKPSTLNQYLINLRAALTMAVNDGMLPRNPAATVKRSRSAAAAPDPFDEAERTAILLAALDKTPPSILNMVTFWMHTGLRTSELFGLKWANVARDGASVMIVEQVVEGTHKAHTKTKAERRVLLNNRARIALDLQRHVSRKSAYVFPMPDTMDPFARGDEDFIRPYWRPLLARAGVRYRRPYNLRHTYATHMLMAGVLPGFAAKQLGHSVVIFLTTYAKWLDGSADAVQLDRINRAFE